VICLLFCATYERPTHVDCILVQCVSFNKNVAAALLKYFLVVKTNTLFILQTEAIVFVSWAS